MSRTGFVVAVAGAFVVGCVAAEQVIVPAYAQQPNARKWEQYCSYRMGNMSDAAEVIEKVNADLKTRGAEGWELAGITSHGAMMMEYCFKRPAP